MWSIESDSYSDKHFWLTSLDIKILIQVTHKGACCIMEMRTLNENTINISTLCDSIAIVQPMTSISQLTLLTVDKYLLQQFGKIIRI